MLWIFSTLLWYAINFVWPVILVALCSVELHLILTTLTTLTASTVSSRCQLYSTLTSVCPMWRILWLDQSWTRNHQRLRQFFVVKMGCIFHKVCRITELLDKEEEAQTNILERRNNELFLRKNVKKRRHAHVTFEAYQPTRIRASRSELEFVIRRIRAHFVIHCTFQFKFWQENSKWSSC